MNEHVTSLAHAGSDQIATGAKLYEPVRKKWEIFMDAFNLTT